MLKLPQQHFAVLRDAFAGKRLDQAVSSICERLRREAPEVMRVYAEPQQAQSVREVIDACDRLRIDDPELVLNWCFIRFLSNVKFHALDQFRDILDHPFLHPNAKGRHVVLAYFAIQRMQRVGAATWPR